ncbi:MAG: nuclear transport factor 2 family protein [Pseudomonadota bacterium]
MANIPAMIDERQRRFLYSWMHRNPGDLKKLASRDCMFVFATNPPEVLDRPSFTASVENDFRCLGYRVGESVVRRHGRAVWFTASADLELKLGAREWQGRFLMTGLWRKFRIGGWKLVEQSLAPLENDKRLADSVRRLQMWQR